MAIYLGEVELGGGGAGGFESIPGSPETLIGHWKGTQAQYDVLGIYDNNVLYIITDIAGNVLNIISDVTGVTGAIAISNIIALTQENYDLIGAPDTNTFYIITNSVDKATPVTTTGTVIDLTVTGGNYMNMGAASANITYTISSASLGGWAKLLVNSPTQPVVTGGVIIQSPSLWTANTDCYLVIENNGVASEFFFLKK